MYWLRITSVSLAILVMVNACMFSIIRVSYEIRKAHITANYCSSPEIAICQGKCFLEKRVEETKQAKRAHLMHEIKPLTFAQFTWDFFLQRKWHMPNEKSMMENNLPLRDGHPLPSIDPPDATPLVV